MLIKAHWKIKDSLVSCVRVHEAYQLSLFSFAFCISTFLIGMQVSNICNWSCWSFKSPLFYIMHVDGYFCLCVLPTCMHVYCMHAISPEINEDIASPEIRVTDNCKPSPGYGKSNLGLLEEQPVPLITELPFQPLCWASLS